MAIESTQNDTQRENMGHRKQLWQPEREHPSVLTEGRKKGRKSV